MNIRSREIELPSYAKLVCILLSLVIIVYGLHELQGLLIPLVFAILFSVLLFPLVQRLENWRVPRILAIIIVSPAGSGCTNGFVLGDFGSNQ